MRDAPTARQYHGPGEQNGAAIFSLVCVAPWPLSILIPYFANIMSGNPATGMALPEQVQFLLSCGFVRLPVAAINAGTHGMRRIAPAFLLSLLAVSAQAYNPAV